MIHLAAWFVRFPVTGLSAKRILSATLQKERPVTLELYPDLAAGLTALAASQGLSVEDYLQRLVERELPVLLDIADKHLCLRIVIDAPGVLKGIW